MTRFAIALLLLPTVVALAQPPKKDPPPPFFQQYAQVGMNFYKNPDPKLGPKMLKDLLKKENLEHSMFARDDFTLILIGAQIGDIVTGKPELVRECEAMFADTTPRGRKVIMRALTNCGDKETAKKVGEWIKDPKYADQKADLEALKANLEDPKRAHVRDVPAKNPEDLDFLWVNFFVTGEYAPISRILDVFDQPATKENETLRRVARWSFGSNVQQHPKLVELVMKHKDERAAGSKKVIEETIITFNPKK
jgi:hypothetical protein